MSDFGEDSLIEQPAIEIFKSLGYDYLNCYNEVFAKDCTLGRETASEVVLIPKLRDAFYKLNPTATSEAIALAIEEITSDLLLPKLISGEIDVEGLDIKGIKNDK